MSHTSLRLSVTLLLTVASPVQAQDSKQEPTELTAYEFEDDLVQGGGFQPGVEVLRVRRRGERESLIRVRTHFVPELLHSADNL